MFAPALPFPRLPDFFRRERFEPRLPSIVRAYKCRDRVTGARTRNTDGTRNRATETTSCPPCPCDCPTGCNTTTALNTATLVASSIDYTSAVGTCFATGGSSSTILTSAPTNPNNTFTLSHTGTGIFGDYSVNTLCCVWWSGALGGTGTSSYANNVCSGSAISPNPLGTQNSFWILVKLANKWWCSFKTQTPATGGQLIWFDGIATTVDPVDCSLTLSFTNSIAAFGASYADGSGHTDTLALGKLGSVSVTFP